MHALSPSFRFQLVLLFLYRFTRVAETSGAVKIGKTLNIRNEWINRAFIKKRQPSPLVSCYNIKNCFNHMFRIGAVMEGGMVITEDSPFLYHRSVNVIEDFRATTVWVNDVIMENNTAILNTSGFVRENDGYVKLERRSIDFDINEIPEVPPEMMMESPADSRKQIYSIKEELVLTVIIGTIYCGEYVMYEGRYGVVEKKVIIDRVENDNLAVIIHEENNDGSYTVTAYEFIPQKDGKPFVLIE